MKYKLGGTKSAIKNSDKINGIRDSNNQQLYFSIYMLYPRP